MSSRDLIPPFAKGKIIKGAALEQLRIASTQQFGGNGAFVDSTGAYQRRVRRRERGIWFKPDTDVPAYGVMYSTGTDETQGELVVTTKKPDGIALGEIILINGPEDVENGAYGKCHVADDVPWQALVNGSETVAAGDVLGPKSSQWDLYKDFPGLIAFDAKDADDLAWVRLDPDPVIRYELKDNIPVSGSVAKEQTGTAYRLKADDTVDTGTEFEIFDEEGVFRGRKNGLYSSPHDRGSQGIVRWNRDQDRLSIVTMTPHALQIMGLINEAGDVVKADSSFDVDAVYVMQPSGAIITDTDPASSTFSITNRSFDGDDDAEAIATWDEKDTDWKALDVICPV